MGVSMSLFSIDSSAQNILYFFFSYVIQTTPTLLTQKMVSFLYILQYSARPLFILSVLTYVCSVVI